jgi:hypothetical protein
MQPSILDCLTCFSKTTFRFTKGPFAFTESKAFVKTLVFFATVQTACPLIFLKSFLLRSLSVCCAMRRIR